jgi:hypothetical protein
MQKQKKPLCRATRGLLKYKIQTINCLFSAGFPDLSILVRSSNLRTYEFIFGALPRTPLTFLSLPSRYSRDRRQGKPKNARFTDAPSRSAQSREFRQRGQKNRAAFPKRQIIALPIFIVLRPEVSEKRARSF